MDVLVALFAFASIPVLGMHLYDFAKKKERPITYKVAVIWLAGFVISIILWRATG